MNAPDGQEDARPVPFVQVPLPLIRHLKPGQLKAWAALKAHDMRSTGEVWPSQQRLAQVAGLDERTIRTVTKQMHDMGVITRSPYGRTGFRYRLHDIAEDWTPTATPEKVAGLPEDVAGLTGKTCRSDRKELPVKPETIAAEVDKGIRSKEADQGERDEPEVETPASGGDSPPEGGFQQTGWPGTGENLTDVVLASEPKFLELLEAKRAERPDGSWSPGGISYRLALAEYRRGVEVTDDRPLGADPSLGLANRLATARDYPGTREELQERNKRTLSERLANFR